MRFPHLLISFSLLIVVMVVMGIAPKQTTWSAPAQGEPHRILLPIGGGYSAIYQGFVEAAISNASGSADSSITILVLPSALTTNPYSISDPERVTHLEVAELRRSQIQEACQQAAPPELSCSVILAPILIRADAQEPDVKQYFESDLAAIFFLGGDQTIAMQVIADTNLEDALEAAYQNGTIVSGTSSAANQLSWTMLNGYNPDYTAGDSLNFGAVDIWNTPEQKQRGFAFGVPQAIIDHNFYQRNHMGRLLNAIALPEGPHIGIGFDSFTGAHIIDDQSLEKVYGLYTVTILDAETYHAADTAHYQGRQNTLSLQNILLHMLAPGDSTYNFDTRIHSMVPITSTLQREYDSIALPFGAGPLILGGNLFGNLESPTILPRFVNLSGGENAAILIVAAGYPNVDSARIAVDQYKNAIKTNTETLILSDQPPTADFLDDYTGIILIGEDQSLIQTQALEFIKDAWLLGKPLFTDNAATAVIGAFFAAHPPTPDDPEDAQSATQDSFLIGETNLLPGLDLLDLNLEPRLIQDNRWGRLFSLAYANPELLSIGISEGTALEINADGASILGQNSAFLLDLRLAKLDQGANQGFIIVNGLLDVFAPGDILKPLAADVEAAPIHLPTPVLPTATPTITMTPIPSSTPEPSPTLVPTKTEIAPTPGKPTPTLRPTATPIYIPPPANPGRTNMVIVFGVLTVVFVIVGVWLNRSRLA